MAKGNPILTTILVAVIVAIIFLGTTGLSIGSWEEGAPEMTVKVTITKDDGNTASAEIGTEDTLNPLTIFNPSVPMTAVEVGVPFVEPDQDYIIEFAIETVCEPESPAVTDMTTVIHINGHNQYGSIYENRNNGAVMQTSIPQIPGVPATASFLNEDYQSPYYLDRSGTDVLVGNRITGADIHDSTFTIRVTSTDNADASIFGTTELDIILKVGSGGSIDVTITGVEATTG